MDDVRVDKWLWAVRIFKTRTASSDACKKKQILINNLPVKSSRTIKVNDIISVKRPPIIYSFKVLALSDKRMGPKLVSEFMENVTPQDQYDILQLPKMDGFIDRKKGLGRPTKKDRRDLDFFTQILDDEFDFED